MTLDVMFTALRRSGSDVYARAAAGPLEQALVIDVQIADLVADHAGGDAELARRGVDVSLRPLEGVGDQVSLEAGREQLEAAGGGAVGAVGHLQGRRQMMSGDHAIVAEQDGVLDAVFQLAHVPGPVVGDHHVDGRRADPMNRLVHLLGVLLDKVIGQQQDVVAALAQRGKPDREHVDPVVQILTEAAVLDGRLQIAIGGRDDPDIDRCGCYCFRLARTAAPARRATASPGPWVRSRRSHRGTAFLHSPPRTGRFVSSPLR